MENEKKYDTNPLDPEAAQRAEAAWSDDPTRALPQRETGFQGNLNEDAPTRHFAGNDGYAPYPSAYTTPPPYQYPPPYAPPPVSPYQPPMAPPVILPSISGKPTSRPVAGINIAEKLALIAPYLPFWIGAVAGLLELFLVPRQEKRVRFHAAQGLAMHLSAIIIPLILKFAMKFGSAIGAWTGLLSLAAALFSGAYFIYFIVYLCKVWKGTDEPLEILAPATQWLNENIAPREK